MVSVENFLLFLLLVSPHTSGNRDTPEKHLADPKICYSLCDDVDDRSPKRLVIGGTVAVVDRVSKGRAAVFCHVRVRAAQYMLLVVGAAWVGPAGTPGCKWPGRWLVLICEEGLVPPINTNSSDKRFPQINRR